jgi:hypothetical protein
MTWRDNCQPIIACVLAATKGQPEAEIKAALKAAYPFGPRQYHPYKIWLDEIRRQRGLKEPLGTRARFRSQRPGARPDPNQPGLFAGDEGASV